MVMSAMAEPWMNLIIRFLIITKHSVHFVLEKRKEKKKESPTPTFSHTTPSPPPPPAVSVVIEERIDPRAPFAVAQAILSLQVAAIEERGAPALFRVRAVGVLFQDSSFFLSLFFLSVCISLLVPFRLLFLFIFPFFLSFFPSFLLSLSSPPQPVCFNLTQ